MQFTKAQLDAIQHPDQNLQLIACAGSGKTEVVARRVAHLLKSGGLLPRNIVAFTFTEKAAAELKERIHARCREEIGEIHGMAEMYVGTIHGFCLDLLKTEVPRYLKFGVLSEVQQVLFVDRHSKQSGLTTTLDIKGVPLKRYVDTGRYVTALSVLRESDPDEKVLANTSIEAGLNAYRGLIDAKAYFDYSSILEMALEALLSPEVKERLGGRIRQVIVDEYQDVNPIQEGIVWALHDLGAAVTVVGDDDQTIYQWRGSDAGNILTFTKRYPNVGQVRLEENFRSSAGVVETARDFIAKNTVRLPKSMIPTAAQPYEPGDIVALSFDTPTQEATHIVETMKSLRGVAMRDGDADRGISWSDMAVLLRTVKGNAEPIMQALDAATIPYVVVGMTNLFDAAEAEAARHLFYFMAGPPRPSAKPGRPDVDEAALLLAWQRAQTGATDANLRAAIAAAKTARDDMDKDDGKRWSFYSLQRVFLDFLENAQIREESVAGQRGDIVFYNLGKFSQVISDFENIHYHSKPTEKYPAFAGFLEHGAESSYPEGWQENQYANPDAVRIMTVHQAKGMQWPVVFVPALLKNRFPSKKQGGRNIWHILPPGVIQGQKRFEGGTEDERRLFYVAMTRAQKFLHLTWAPVPGNQLYQKVSEFWEDVLVSKWVKRRKPDYSARKRLAPTPRAGVANVVLTFSDMKYFFECPYQFKLRILYGFNAPIHEALGYGKSLHDVLAEVHARAIQGDIAGDHEVPALVKTHLHTPFAYPALREKLTAAAEKVVRDYLHDNRARLDKVELSEKAIELGFGDGVSVVGRIDLVRRVDTGEVTIVDLKSDERAQAEDVTNHQLHIYALGYQELTGRNADYVEIYNLDQRKAKPRSVDDDFIDEVKAKVRGAADALRQDKLPPTPTAKKCAGCDYRRMCTPGAAVAPTKTP